MPYEDLLNDLEYGGFTTPSKYAYDDTVDTYKYALNHYFGIDTDNICESESERIARVFGLDDIKNWYPSGALVCARGNGKSLYCSERWKQIIKPKVEKVIFNEPATIVLWSDGTKTVVKCDENEKFDKEKGLAMAIAKRFLRTNTTGSNYYDEFKKWIPEEENIPYVETGAGTVTLYADGLPILGAKLDKEINELSRKLYDMTKIPEEKLGPVKGKHMKGE